MSSRERLAPNAIGLGFFTAMGALFDSSFWDEAWFYIGVGVAVSRVFVEPRRASRPQDAIINAVGGVAAYFAVERDPLELVWTSYLILGLLILAAGAAASLIGSDASTLKRLSYRFASRLGRALIIGDALLAAEVVGYAANQVDGYEYLAVGSIGLLIASGPDWAEALRILRERDHTWARAEAAIGPRLLLLAAPHLRVAPGQRLQMRVGDSLTEGVATAIFPHQNGPRYQIALDDDVVSLCPSFPVDVDVSLVTSDEAMIGAVGAGSTDTTLAFEPLRELPVGMPVALNIANGYLLYQVASLQLRSITWGNARVLAPQATATQIGWPHENFVRSRPFLPPGHTPLYAAPPTSMIVPEGFHRIGVIIGTAVEIGVDLDKGNGHLAILGMSGMGKTAVVHRIGAAVGLSKPVMALDLTGEYRSKLGIAPWAGDIDAIGFTVYQPSGDPPAKATEFIKKCMERGSDEYLADPPKQSPRVVVLEEAHTFVPEFTFALKKQMDSVSFSARMIMQARKYKLAFIIVSQRTAVVSKSVLSQCENYIILKTIDETSLEYVETVVGADIREAIPRLRPYQAVCTGPAFNSDEPVIIDLDAPK